MVKLRNLTNSIGLASAIAVSSLGCETEECPGWDYGALTAEKKVDLEQRVADLVERKALIIGGDSDCGPHEDGTPAVCEHFCGTPKEYASHFTNFYLADFAARGMDVNSLGDADLIVFPMQDTGDYCSSNADGCYSSGEPIKIKDNRLMIRFATTFNHEFGHYLADGTGLEFDSKSNEMYSAIRAYSFSKPIGSLFLDNVFNWIGREQLENLRSQDYKYAGGALYALINLIAHKGDSAAAFYHQTHKRTPLIQEELRQWLQKNPVDNGNQALFKLWMQILDDEEITKNFLGGNYLTEEERKEYSNYLKVKAYQLYSRSFPDKEAKTQELKTFLEQSINERIFVNPYFRAEAIAEWTNHKHRELLDSYTDDKKPTAETFDIAKKMIELNADYPCDETKSSLPAYECSLNARAIRSSHVSAYLRLARAANYLQEEGMYDTAASFALDFANRFYQKVPLNEAKQKETNNCVPYVTLYPAAGGWKELDPNLIAELLTAAVSVKCLEDKDAACATYDSCVKMQNQASEILQDLNHFNPILKTFMVEEAEKIIGPISIEDERLNLPKRMEEIF